MSAKATLEDLARKAGVHRSTVSLALRDHPRISLAVRRRIKALAEKMGYRVNPLVAALMKSRRTRKAMQHVVLAYVTNYPTRYGWRPPHHDRPDYFPGAAERATELGFKLEHFWLAEPGMTPERFCDILTMRGIHGLVVGRLPPGQQEMKLLWERFSCVALGRTLRSPVLHHVTEDHFAGSWRAMEQTMAKGYRRIGLVFGDADDSPRVGDRWLGGFLRQQLRLPEADRLPPLFFSEKADHAAEFAVWYRRWKPEAVIVTQAMPVLKWMEPLGLRVNKDLGLVTLVNDHVDQNWTGIHCSPAKLGALAIEMLVGLLHRGERGAPQEPHEVLLSGEWCEGTTLPERPAVVL